MGTRGKFGFFYKGKYYFCYNHYDSYPSNLGVHLLLEILHANLDEWIKLLENIKEVSDDVEPTSEDILKLRKYTSTDVGEQSKYDWYCLLRYTQGSFHHVLNSGYMENVEGDMGEEYTYILDFDNMVFKANGDGLDDVEIKVEKEELLKYARKWAEGPLDENYDPEKEMLAMKELYEKQKMMMQKMMQMGNDKSFAKNSTNSDFE